MNERFQKLYEEQLQYVWNCLRRLDVCERDLPDLCHDVFLVDYNNWDEYDEDRPLQPWLFGIAFRFASNYRDKASQNKEILDEPGVVPESPEVVDTISKKEAKAMVMEALDSVDLDKRALFILHELDGHDMKDVAAELGIPIQTAYSRFNRAMEHFESAAEAMISEEQS